MFSNQTTFDEILKTIEKPIRKITAGHPAPTRTTCKVSSNVGKNSEINGFFLSCRNFYFLPSKATIKIHFWRKKILVKSSYFWPIVAILIGTKLFAVLF
jgi:hypothetical protein